MLGNKKLEPILNTALPEGVQTYKSALLFAMRQALVTRPDTVIFGQGADDHKGSFGSTTDLAKEFGPNRVMDVPLAEEATTGMAIGAALNGIYPIQLHIRSDFSLLAMNQIINLAAKYRYMFGGQMEVPMMIRMVIGRSWGQGAQHSQSLQSLFAHIPGLTVLMPATPQAILDCYPYAINEYKNPVISIEHRLLYDLSFQKSDYLVNPNESPFTSYRLREGKDVTIVATSIMVLEALRAAEFLSKHSSLDCEVIDLNCVSNPNVPMILESVRKTGKLLIADTSWKGYGVCAEICRLICEIDPSSLKSPVTTLGMAPVPCPTAKSLEDIFYPNLGVMVDSIAKLITGKDAHGVSLPDEKSMADVYKHFKGPF